MTQITDGIFPEMFATEIEIGGEEKEPSVGAESSQVNITKTTNGLKIEGEKFLFTQTVEAISYSTK